jgi:hypothetical protein
MEAEQRIQALEQEVQILKTQIQSILLDIQTHLLTNAYPALRGHHTASSPTEDEEDDDEYDRAAPAPKVRKVTANSVAAKQPKAVVPPVPAEPMLASLDEQQDWVLQNIQRLGLNRTRDLIQGYTESHQFTPEVSDTLMRFTNMYAAAAEEPTIPSRPVGMPTAQQLPVRSVNSAPKQTFRAPAQPQPQTYAPAPQQTYAPMPQQTYMPAQQQSYAPVPEPQQRRGKPVQQTPTVKPQAPAPRPQPVVQQPVQSEPTDNNSEPNLEVGEPSSLVLRLIAGVQNAGAGVRWGKTKS